MTIIPIIIVVKIILVIIPLVIILYINKTKRLPDPAGRKGASAAEAQATRGLPVTPWFFCAPNPPRNLLGFRV